MSSLPSGRRSHRKSRAGCLQCKRRKVKCDEIKPRCGNCAKHGVSCSFTVTTLPVTSNEVKPIPRIEAAPASEIASPNTWATFSQGTQNANLSPILGSNLPVFDMELLHHYMISTCYTISRTPAIQAIWRDEAPRIGFRMPAALHAILAISALHLARSDPSRKASCIAQAHIHHDTALRLVTPNMSLLAEGNGPGLFLVTSLTCIFSCARAQSEDNFLVLFEQGRLTDWALLFRGTKTVIQHSKQSDHDFLAGPLAPIFINGGRLSAIRRDAQTLEQGQVYVWELKQMIRKELQANEEQRKVYLETADAIGRTLAVVMKPGEGPNLQTADVFAWLLEVSDEYLQLLLQEQHIALIIFGYFSVALRQIEWMWWMEGISHRLMRQLFSALDERFHVWLKWPQEQISWEDP
ncbi:C6 transcription factor [Penicillium macrosclerotiorum]|uniref:C6 transcription factor n=1 Tax=Penicillium macrosclerotiorum TaxID=303699 RepID=UPI002548AE1A|nr:C6 transcription factor [Penicillium macrosclerotiorum]KAJ5676166.1 C6 transcription factor [Penicillium macrosclerotiorum]